MNEGYWRYADPRQQQLMAPATAAAPAAAIAAAPLKRPRTDYPEVPAGSEILGYYPRGEERTAPHAIRDTQTLNASYDRYLQNGMSSFGVADPARPVPVSGALTGLDPRLAGADPRLAGLDPLLAGLDQRLTGSDPRLIGVGSMDLRTAGYGTRRPELALPSDASSTLYVEGLPANCSRREVSHIFRPFVGFREVRLVNKESRHSGGDPLVLCFVDFATASQAAVALEALQGYKFDEHERDSANLRLEFARNPGPRSAGGSRGRR